MKIKKVSGTIVVGNNHVHSLGFITDNEIEQIMVMVRTRHGQQTCVDRGGFGRVVCMRDTDWSHVSADMVQEILVEFARIRQAVSEAKP